MPDVPFLRQASRRICYPPSKKCPNLFMLWGFAIPNTQALASISMGQGDCKSPGIIGRTFFLRRIAYPSGRLAGWNAQRKTALCTLRRKRNIAQHVINIHPEGTRFDLGVKIGRKLHVFAHAYAAPRRNLCRPPGRLCRNNIISYKKYIV